MPPRSTSPPSWPPRSSVALRGRLARRSHRSSSTTSSSPTRATRSRSANPPSGSASSCCCSSASSSGSSRRCNGPGPRMRRPASARRAPCSTSAGRLRPEREPRRSCRRSPASCAAEARMDRVWVALGPDGSERVVADTGTDARLDVPSVHLVLRRMPGDEPAQWVRVHAPTRLPGSKGGRDLEAYRVRIEAAGDGARLDLGASAARRRRPRRCRDPAPRRGRRPDRPGNRARPPRGGGPGGGDRATERRAQVGAAPVGLARPADAAGDDPRRGRDPAPRQSGCRPRTRPRAPTRSIARSSTSTGS